MKKRMRFLALFLALTWQPDAEAVKQPQQTVRQRMAVRQMPVWIQRERKQEMLRTKQTVHS